MRCHEATCALRGIYRSPRQTSGGSTRSCFTTGCLFRIWATSLIKWSKTWEKNNSKAESWIQLTYTIRNILNLRLLRSNSEFSSTNKPQLTAFLSTIKYYFSDTNKKNETTKKLWKACVSRSVGQIPRSVREMIHCEQWNKRGGN